MGSLQRLRRCTGNSSLGFVRTAFDRAALLIIARMANRVPYNPLTHYKTRVNVTWLSSVTAALKTIFFPFPL